MFAYSSLTAVCIFKTIMFFVHEELHQNEGMIREPIRLLISSSTEPDRLRVGISPIHDIDY